VPSRRFLEYAVNFQNYSQMFKFKLQDQ